MPWFFFELPDRAYRPWRNVWTPFLRRFTDERGRDLAETRRLHDEVRARHQASKWNNEQAVFDLCTAILHWAAAHCGPIDPALPLFQPLLDCQLDVLEREHELFAPPAVPWGSVDAAELVALKNLLRAKRRFHDDEARVIAEITAILGSVFAGLWGDLPRIGAGAAGFTVPLIGLVPDPRGTVARLMGTFLGDGVVRLDLFADLRERFYRNACDASGQVPGTEHAKPLVAADESDLPPPALVETYLRGTPYRDLFLTPVPFAIPRRARLEHWHLVGASGSGKTQCLQTIILDYLREDDPPALVVVDSHRGMLDKLERLALFDPAGGRLADRLVVLDPEDERPPALNMFDTATPRLAGYARTVREQVEAGVIDLYAYIFGALDAALTAKQGTAFSFVARLLLSMEGATVHSFRQLMEEDARTLEQSAFAAAIRRLDPTAQAFFERQFFTKAFADTRVQVARRLYDFLRVPAFDRIFAGRRNRIDWFDALQSGKIVLVNTAKGLLKGASPLFGRYAIAQVLAAAFERVAVPERERRDAFLIVDEAQTYFDERLEELLAEARKFRLGVLFAHQHMGQLVAAGLRAAVATNTSVKMCGGVSEHDARLLAPDMNTTAEVLRGTRKVDGQWGEFACHVRNVTPAAVTLRIPFGALEAEPRMSDRAHRRLRALNRARYGSVPVAEPAQPEAKAGPEPSPDDTIKLVAPRPRRPPAPDDDVDTSAARW